MTQERAPYSSLCSESGDSSLAQAVAIDTPGQCAQTLGDWYWSCGFVLCLLCCAVLGVPNCCQCSGKTGGAGVLCVPIAGMARQATLGEAGGQGAPTSNVP